MGQFYGADIVIQWNNAQQECESMQYQQTDMDLHVKQKWLPLRELL